MGRLTTHVLDTSRGSPAAGMRVELFREGGALPALSSVITNREGRANAPLLAGPAFLPGAYRLVFYVGDYFRQSGQPDAGRFLEEVPVVFIVSDSMESYHVPLLVSPWSYATYRGS